MKMSRRGWNNIIIFAVASMILIFKYVELNNQQSESEQQLAGQLLPQGATILRIELPELVIERVGTQWRSEPPTERSIAVIDAWLHITLEPWQNALGGAASSQGVHIYLANSAAPIELTLFELGQQRWLTNWQGQLLSLDEDSYHALFPTTSL
ncbi:hypothetical protein AHAT_31570 [Agarivorans sp. Toyoura001]|uniref:hypothetical protein n=1 Tax=Agarivorans sp. Toyoura001 TaxID=2283141 RepID=UPI0010ECEBB2|nr:hypothetical protein [Agarivorans sp. Toyoura001]GDY27267.1 hypothetical protein AHAT_31570 [Agarivorans sp. Toyoura001]